MKVGIPQSVELPWPNPSVVLLCFLSPLSRIVSTGLIYKYGVRISRDVLANRTPCHFSFRERKHYLSLLFDVRKSSVVF